MKTTFEEFFKWLEEQKPFALNLLMRDYPFTAEDAEDTFNDLRAKYLEDPTKCFTVLKRRVLFLRLHRAAIDRVRRARALRNGGGAVHQSIDEIGGRTIEVYDNSWESMELRDELKFLELQLQTIEPRCISAVQNQVRKVMLRALYARDDCFDHLSDLFSQPESEQFMKRRDFTKDQLRRKTNRVHRSVKELMAKALGRSQSGEGLN